MLACLRIGVIGARGHKPKSLGSNPLFLTKLKLKQMKTLKLFIVLLLSIIFQGILLIPRSIAGILNFIENVIRIIKEIITLCTNKIESEVLKN